MGKGRFVCVSVPLLLTILCLVFQIMIGLGGTNINNSYLSNLYFMQANATSLSSNPQWNNIPATANTDPASIVNGRILMKSYYTIGLWNYCSGSGVTYNASNPLNMGQNYAHQPDFCTGRRLQYWFNPRDVWGLVGVAGDNIIGPNAQNYLDYYGNTASRWISTLYILTIVATSLEIIIGIGGLASRVGSLFTTISALITTLLSFSFAILTTAVYTTLAANFNAALQPENITFSLGRAMLAYVWLSASFSFMSIFFWALSSCCCAASRHTMPADAEKPVMGITRTPYTYERVSEPEGRAQMVQGYRAT